jgi:hypothetical protein
VSSDRLTFEAYRAIEAANWSSLKHLRKSPLLYQYELHTVPPSDSDGLRVGRGTHTAVLEPDRLAVEYAIWKGGRRAGAEWDEFCEAHATETILTLGQYEAVCAIRDAVRSHPVAEGYLRSGIAEQAITWTDERTGIACKGRLDWVSDAGTLIDLKTSRSAVDPRAFAASAYAFGYFHQVAFYLRGLRATRGAEPPAVIIAVETSPPHDVCCYRVSEDAIYAANEELDDLLETLRLCRETGAWRGRFSDEQELDMPRWAYPFEDDGSLIADPDWMHGS